jgi:hypothetical protein
MVFMSCLPIANIDPYKINCGRDRFVLKKNKPLDLPQSAGIFDAIFFSLSRLERAGIQTKLFGTSLEVLDYLKRTPSALFLAKKCNTTCGLLNLMTCPARWYKVAQSVDSLSRSYLNKEPTELFLKQRQRKWDKLFKDSTKAIAATGKGAQMALQITSKNRSILTPLGPLLKYSSFVETLISLKINFENLRFSLNKCPEGDSQFAFAIEETRMKDLLLFAKDFLSLIFILIIISADFIPVSSALYLGLSLSILVFGFASQVYQENMTWKAINYYEDNQVTQFS